MDIIKEQTEDFVDCLNEHKTCVATAVVVACGYWALWKYMQGGVCRSKARMDGKTVLITGANTGIGLETAKDLAKRGARVLIACRNKEKGEAAVKKIQEYSGNNDVTLYIMDLSSLQSVRDCAALINEKEPRLDVLINNAGNFLMSQQKSKDGFELQLATNHLGPFLFTNLLLDLLKKSAPSRIVTVSAHGHKMLKGSIQFDDINMEKNFSAFNANLQSKLANILFTLELSKRLKGSDVTANSLHPGAVATDLVRFLDEYTFPVRIVLKVFNKIIQLFVKTPKSGAQTSIYLAVDPDVTSVTGKYFSDCALATPSAAAMDEEAAARLWTLSEELVGLAKNN